jgi:hypothetical protein
MPRLAYGLGNGTVGVFEGPKRMWRVKSKHGVECVVGFDATGDGVLDVATGYSNGAVTVRCHETGEVLVKIPAPSSSSSSPSLKGAGGGSGGVAAMVVYDYRMDRSSDGNDPTGSSESAAPQLIVCTSSGEVRGYSRKSADEIEHGGGGGSGSGGGVAGASSAGVVESKAAAAAIKSLQQRKVTTTTLRPPPPPKNVEKFVF